MATGQVKSSTVDDKSKQIILVTGASGFIALHLVRLLLKEGYQVRGTVRSLRNTNKLKPLKEICPESSSQLELVEADLTKDEGWAEAVSDCHCVMHVASPFPNAAPKNEDELMKPAVEGTLRVLNACAQEVAKNNKKLKRVILTSSIVSVHGETTEDKELYTEEDWSDLNSRALETYPKSKTMAEKAAWDLVKSLPEDQRFELATINPGVVLGPILSDEAATSVEIIYRMMDYMTMPLIPRVHLCICDVRDVALAHLRAMVVPEAAGHRHLIVSGHFWMGEMATILHNEFAKFGYRVPLFYSPYIALWFYSFLDKSSRLMLTRYNKKFFFDDQRMKNILGMDPIKPEDTLLETAHDLIQRGILNKTKKYNPQPIPQ